MPFSVLGRGGGCLLAAFVHRQGVKSREFVFQIIGYLWKGLQRRRERGTEGVRKEVEMVKGFANVANDRGRATGLLRP